MTDSKNGTSPITLIKWLPTNIDDLTPATKGRDYKTNQTTDLNIHDYMSDNAAIDTTWNYGNSKALLDKWEGGVYVQDTNGSIAYLNKNPWHVTVTNNSTNVQAIDRDWGWYLDIGNIDQITNDGDANIAYYGYVRQIIHFVDEDGNQMKDTSGNVISDVVRQVMFTSKDGKKFTLVDPAFTDISTSKPVVGEQPYQIPEGYTAYRGSGELSKNGSTGEYTITVDKDANSNAKHSDSPISAIGKYDQNDGLTFPHSDMLLNVVYVKGEPQTATPKTSTKTVTWTIHFTANTEDGPQLAKDITQTVTYNSSRYFVDKDGQIVAAHESKDANGDTIYIIDEDQTPDTITWTASGADSFAEVTTPTDGDGNTIVGQDQINSTKGT